MSETTVTDPLRTVLVAAEHGLTVHTLGDIRDLLDACFGIEGLILDEGDLGADFFNLRTGLAGELLQKFVNYQIRTLIVVRDVNAYGERFSELIREHRSHPLIRFYTTRADGEAWLYRR